METTVYVIRHGVTDWHTERKVLGQRDIALNLIGIQQAHGVSAALADIALGEIISSPLLRAVQTAEILAEKKGGAITRDPRLSDFRVGKWEAMGYDEVARLPEYQRFVADPLKERLPGGETLAQIRERAIGAVDQALQDAPAGESLAIVTHAGIARVLLAHYLGIDPLGWHRLRLLPGSISILSFHDDRTPPRVRALGWRASLKDLIS